jgi:calcineurin-like phosphoesterase family protein
MRNNSVNIYGISDTHFCHNKLVCSGLKSVKDDERVLGDLSIVRVSDILIHLGDVSFYNDDQWHTAFNNCCAGKTILVLGNHDRKSLTWYYSHGWDFVCNEFKLDVYGESLIFSHKPICMRTNSCINIHGHLHDDNHRVMTKTKGRSFLVYNRIVNIKTLIGK